MGGGDRLASCTRSRRGSYPRKPVPVTFRHLPTSARAVAVAASQAVAGAQRHDRDALDAGVRALAVAEGSGLVLGAVVRLLIEKLHPAGVGGEDIRRILTDVVPAARQWQPAVDPHAMLGLLAGALGVHDRDDHAPPPTPEAGARHAALLIAHLLGPDRPPVDGYLTAAFAEIERGERHD